LVMVVGSLRSFYAQNSRTSNYLLRDVLFYKIVNIKKISPLSLLEYIFERDFAIDEKTGDFVFKTELEKQVRRKTIKKQFEISKIINFANKISNSDVRKYFNKYFTSKINLEGLKSIKDAEIDQHELVNFLFILTKKTMTGIFTFRGMRIVKSKIKEYITRNRYETLNREELTRFFKPSD
ncbi:putative telomerase reverse transcriptase, partial [Pseudoloma neurophilia]